MSNTQPNRAARGVALASLFLALLATPAGANFHLWDVNEIYTNADGTVQFVEFFTDVGGQEFLVGHLLQTAQDDVVQSEFVFPSSLPIGPGTANRHFLVATPDFVSAAGITPDYVIPIGFIQPGIVDEVTLVGASDAKFDAAALPTDGVHSLNDAGGGNDPTVEVATPTNFAGEVGMIVPEADGVVSGLAALLSLRLLARRSASGPR